MVHPCVVGRGGGAAAVEDATGDPSLRCLVLHSTEKCEGMCTTCFRLGAIEEGMEY